MMYFRLASITVLVFFVALLFAPQVFAAEESVILEQARHPLGYNCVLWARSMEPRLPQGLYTQENKEALINAWEPHVGAIAVTAESAAGHVAIVRGANDEAILVEEANYIAGYVTLRRVPRSAISGYIVFEQAEETV